jgi:hypothetical protein
MVADEQASASRPTALGDADTASRLPWKVQEFLEGSAELEAVERAKARLGQVRARQSQLLRERASAEAADRAAAAEAAGEDNPPQRARELEELEAELQALGAEEGTLAGEIEKARGLALAATRPLAVELAGELEQQAVAAVAHATRDVEDARKSLEHASMFAAEARWCERLAAGDPGPFVSSRAQSRAIPELDDALAWIARDETERQERLRSTHAGSGGEAEPEQQAGAPGAA